MSTIPPPSPSNLCPLCGVALGRSADVEAHTRTQLCASTVRTKALHAEGFVRAPDDRQVMFVLVVSVCALGRVEDTALLPSVPPAFAGRPFSERWWPLWAVELAVALVAGNVRRVSAYPERLRLLAAAPEERREAALSTLRSAGVLALDAFLFRSATTSEVPRG